MIWRVLLVFWIWMAGATSAADARIMKVLPHLLDSKGRNALAPSLFERDAYQLYLRENPEEISSLRFDVHFKSRLKEPMVLRMEIRGSKMEVGRTRIFETDVQPRRWGSTWAALHLNRQLADEIGNILAWRASLWHNGQEIAELESFLW